jgi:hypothetical protein
MLFHTFSHYIYDINVCLISFSLTWVALLYTYFHSSKKDLSLEVLLKNVHEMEVNFKLHLSFKILTFKLITNSV